MFLRQGLYQCLDPDLVSAMMKPGLQIRISVFWFNPDIIFKGCLGSGLYIQI